jgi:hypothetical protein
MSVLQLNFHLTKHYTVIDKGESVNIKFSMGVHVFMTPCSVGHFSLCILVCGLACKN